MKVLETIIAILIGGLVTLLIIGSAKCVEVPDPTTARSTDPAEAIIIYADDTIILYRVHVNGLPYLVNSNGGIVLEASELEYGALLDATKDGSK